LARPQTYVITFAGQAGSTLCAEFDDCEVIAGLGTTTLHVGLPDQAALTGLVLRITGLGSRSSHAPRGTASRGLRLGSCGGGAGGCTGTCAD
jgi:hypothetical protein